MFGIGSTIQMRFSLGGANALETSGVSAIVALSSAEYTAITTKSATTLYIVQYTDHTVMYLGTKQVQDASAIHGDGSVENLVAVAEMPQSPDEHTAYIKEESS